PSVLTLDGRHAHIEIAEDVPIIEQSKYQSSDQWDMNVRFVEAGILLSINPRVSNDGKWVTMQVQTEVSEENESDAVTTRDGEFVAPRIERRKVQSMSRIRNNHPFIIGGLIRDNSTSTVEKIPLLGDIPLLGHLFRKSESKDEKREIIIVLTPRVIERGSSDRAITPKDSDKFDNFDTQLFRETYTLKSEDIYDLGFVLDQADIQRTLERAQDEIQYNPELADAKPYSLVADGGIPGEEAIVNRMLYDVVRKLELFREISLDKLIFFQPDDSDPSGFHVTWLEQELEKIAGDKTVDQHLESDYPKDVLYVIYEMDEELADKPNLRYPVATTKVESQSDSDSAEARLYELGKVEGTSRDRIAFMIGSKRDLERLKISIIVREILNINDPSSLQQLDNFTVKRRIAIPEVDPEGDRTFLIDRRVAKPFFMSNFYYAEFQEIFQSVIEDLRNDLK
ncbi:MAG: type II secretion system protein GspD, partial [Planctomycetota bacterium]